MKTVDLNSDFLTGIGLKSQANYSKNIQSLTLSADRLSNQGLIQILQQCGTGLKTLGIPNSRITGEGFSVFQDKLIHLEALNLADCYNITKQGMIELLQICGTGLKFLDL